MLIGTGAVKSFMKIESTDHTANVQLGTLISAVQKFCDNYTGRILEAATYTSNPEYCIFDGTGRPFMYLQNYPVSYVSDVRVDGEREFADSTLIGTDAPDIYFYPKSGKVVSENGYFTTGRRNVRVDYIAGYAPIVGGTHDSTVSSYPSPYDLTQTMIEMVAQSYKEGVTFIRSVETAEGGQTFTQLLSANSFWRKTLNAYKSYDTGLGAYSE